LGNDAVKSSATVVKTGRELEKEAAHALAKQIGDMAEVTDQRFRAGKAFGVRDEFRGFDRENEFPPPNLANPRAHGC